MIVGNWKMNLDIQQAKTLVSRLNEQIIKTDAKIVLCPNYIVLSTVSELLYDQGITKFSLGVQNINDHDDGPFTGEVSALMVKGLAKYAIIGHSERRVNYDEDNQTIAKKLATCVRHNITPILCVGENLHERQEGLAQRTIIDQLEQDLSEMVTSEVSQLVIAYEPIWAIGTGENASPSDVEKMMMELYRYFVNKYNELVASKITLLYGGSVDADNAKSYTNINKVGGLLVGGASLNYKVFSKICQL